MTLQEYIRKEGVPKCAKQFGVKQRTVYYWLSGDVQPSLPKAKRICKVARLTLGEIYG